jgi:proteasome lid subunit RPN8/RPN11
VIGYFHSHPTGAPVPSATDRAMAARDGRIWAIIAGNDVRFWADGDRSGHEGFVALSFAIIES